MTYSIVFSSKARDQFKKLERIVQGRMVAALERIRIRPEIHVIKLVGDPGFRLRVGDHRVIVDIDRGRLVILVLTVGHRKTVYRKK